MPVMPLVTSLRNPGMRARHWTELTKVTGKDMEVCPKDEFTLTKLKELNLDETPQSLEAVTKVCDVAGKEYAIEQVTRSPTRGTAHLSPHASRPAPLAPHLPPPHLTHFP